VLFGNDYKMAESGYRQKGQTRIESIKWKLDQILCTLFVKRKSVMKVKVTGVLQIDRKVQRNDIKNNGPLGYRNDACTADTVTPNIKNVKVLIFPILHEASLLSPACPSDQNDTRKISMERWSTIMTVKQKY
jgi:hypothetical protein